MAALRLITSSNLTGAWTGSSLGFLPIEDAINIGRCAQIIISAVISVGQQAAEFSEEFPHRRHLVHRGCRRDLGATRRGHARRARSARAHVTTRSLRMCTAWCNAGCAAAHVGAAPQRYFRLLRRRPEFTEITGVEPSTFGFAVAVHPRDPDTAWFVPEIKDEKRIPRDGKLVVTRTRDGGKSFESDQGPAAVARL